MSMGRRGCTWLSLLALLVAALAGPAQATAMARPGAGDLCVGPAPAQGRGSLPAAPPVARMHLDLQCCLAAQAWISAPALPAAARSLTPATRLAIPPRALPRTAGAHAPRARAPPVFSAKA